MSLDRKAVADALYDAYCDGPRFRRDFPDKPETFRWTIDEIGGDRDASAEMAREPWLRAADECIRQTRHECDRIEALEAVARALQGFVDDERGILGPTLAEAQEVLAVYVQHWGKP